MALQGPHQSAQKSTRTGGVDCNTSCANVLSVTSRTFPMIHCLLINVCLDLIVACTPSWANSRAIAAPMPVPLPVTIATVFTTLIDVSSEGCDEICRSIDSCSSYF
jgi:hypothetical protein